MAARSRKRKSVSTRKTPSLSEQVLEMGYSEADSMKGVFAEIEKNTKRLSAALGKNKKAEHERIREERGSKYGNALINHDAIGKQWTGLLENHFNAKLPHDIPGFMVALMMVAVKLNRESFAHTSDNYVDGHNYLDIAAECRQAEEKLK